MKSFCQRVFGSKKVYKRGQYKRFPLNIRAPKREGIQCRVNKAVHGLLDVFFCWPEDGALEQVVFVLSGFLKRDKKKDVKMMQREDEKTPGNRNFKFF